MKQPLSTTPFSNHNMNTQTPGTSVVGNLLAKAPQCEWFYKYNNVVEHKTILLYIGNGVMDLDQIFIF